MATIVRESPVVKCSNRFSVFNTGNDLNVICTELHDIPCNKPAMILCSNHAATADDSYILLNDVNVQNDLCNNPDDSSILQTEATDTTADDSSILHNEGIGQYDISNNPTADDSSILHDEVNGQHDLTSLSNMISKPGLKIGCLNIRGLLGKIDEIRAILNSCQFDIFCLCETFIDMNVGNDEIDIDGYSIEMCNRNRHGGGVLMYVKDGIKYTNITNMTSSSVESTWINIKHTGESLAVGVMYRPPLANAEYFSNMLDQLDHVHSEYDNVILLGDLNHNYVFGERLRANPLYQLETLYNMKQLVDVPTRETLNTSSLLDVIFTTNDQSHSTTGVYKIGLSDHYMIFTVYSNVHDRDGHHEKVLTFRNYKTFSTERFLNDLISLECLHDTDWCSSLLESKWYEFKNAFSKLSNEHAPIQCRRLKNKSNSWFDADILAMIYRRDYLKRKAIACKDRRLWQDYRSQRNAVTRVIRQRKRNYYDEKINESQSNPKKLWKVLNQLTGKQHRDEIPGDLNANEFNDYFTSVGSDTVSHFNVSESDTLFWRGSNCVSRFEFMTIQPESINAQLNALGLSSKTDVLGFDSKLLCLSSDILTPIITKFANASLETNCVLNDWKLSRVTPIYKGKGDVNDKGNYRPISVISHIAKIIER